jgi:hypothetical protein
LVAVVIVDRFEVVDVDQHAGERMLVATSAPELVGEPRVDHPPVDELGEPIDGGQLGEVLVDALELVGKTLDAQHRRHANLQLERVDRLAQELVGPSGETTPFGIQVLERGQQDDRRISGIALEHLRELVAVEVGHHHVE